MTAINFCKPLWKEGMFLAPQHMQQNENYRDAVESILTQASLPYPWGLKSIEIDVNLLSSFQFSVQRLEAVAPSHDIVSFPGNIEIPSRSFESVLTDPQQSIKVYVGIPDLVRNGPNLVENSQSVDDGARFRFSAYDVEITDENNGISERTIQVRQIRARIFFEGEDTEGYQLFPIARIRPAPNMEGAVLDESYVPPVLQVGAWPPLQKSLEGIAAKLTALQSNLSRMIGTKSVAETCSRPRGVELVLKLQAVNQAFLVMQQISGTGSLPPYFAYGELLRTIGLFWTFKGDQKFPKIPVYDHLHMGTSFETALAIIRQLCTILDTQGYIRRPFAENQGRMEVDLDAEWLSGSRKLYIAITGAGDYNEAIKRFASIRVCAPSHFVQVLQRRIQALQLQWLRRSPSSLPAGEGMVYAEVLQTGRFWPGVVTEMALAVGSSEKLPYRFELFVE